MDSNSVRIDYKEHKATTVQQVDLITNERAMLFELPVEQARYPFQDTAPMQVKNLMFLTKHNLLAIHVYS